VLATPGCSSLPPVRCRQRLVAGWALQPEVRLEVLSLGQLGYPDVRCLFAELAAPLWIGPVAVIRAFVSRAAMACQRPHRAGGGQSLLASSAGAQCDLVAGVPAGKPADHGAGWTSLLISAGV